MRILLDPPMQQKLFLMLALVVLLGALVEGNPFLPNGRDRAPAGLVPLHALAPTVPERLGAGSPDRLEARPLPTAALAVDLQHAGRDAQPVSASSRRARAAAAVATECPDPMLRPLVVAVESNAAGAPIWVLTDGRRLRRNPLVGAGQPVLVPVGAGEDGPPGKPFR